MKDKFPISTLPRWLFFFFFFLFVCFFVFLCSCTAAVYTFGNYVYLEMFI